MDIFDIKMRDGTPVNSVAEAVKKFMCPGPCSPDCPLYDQIRIEGDTFGHKCHPAIYARYPVSVLDAMRCSYSTRVGDPMPDDKNGPIYAAVIKSNAVRDVQYCKNAEHDPLDDGAWEDLYDAEVWLGFFRGKNALQKAAEFAGTDPDNIRLIPVGQDAEKEADTNGK